MSLSPNELKAVETALTGPNGEQLMALMQRLTTQGRPKDDFSDEVLEEARSLGWIDRLHFPTKLGWKIGDPLREFVQWNRRDRKVHDWERLKVLRREYFEDRRMLAIGCGCGTNLFSFQEICKEVVGVEVEPVYLQFTPLWARLAEVPVPRTVLTGAENMPFPDADFDLVVCFGALQYMEIRDALREVARVLKPGGLFVFTLSDLRGYLTELTTRARTFRRPQEVIREAAILANMLVYPWTGRVIVRKHDPVYPRVRQMRAWLDDAGLTLDDDLTEAFDHEYCYVARKR